MRTTELVQEAPAAATSPVRDRHRLVGPDVVRAMALIGVVVMNYHGYLISAGGERATNFWGRVFDPWTGPLSTRFAATFVLTAGVGVTLFTRNAIGDAAATNAKRWVLVRRGLFLYAIGLYFYVIWPGAILPYYGAMFVVAALIFTLPTAAVAAIGTSAALAGAGIRWWMAERAFDGHSTRWLTNPPQGSARGLVLNVFVNGTHPLLPWLAFFCAGIIVGRLLSRAGWQAITLTAGITLYGFSRLLGDALTTDDRTELTRIVASTVPRDRGLLYVCSALGTALIAFTVIATIATRLASTPPVRLLAHAGQMTLSLYVAHIYVFRFTVDWMGWVRPSGLDLALTFAAVYWTIAIAAGWAWHRRFGIGPAEWVYRKIGG